MIDMKHIRTKKAQHSPLPQVKGPGIDALIAIVHDMLGRGAPTVLDNTGFNKIHFSFFL